MATLTHYPLHILHLITPQIEKPYLLFWGGGWRKEGASMDKQITSQGKSMMSSKQAQHLMALCDDRVPTAIDLTGRRVAYEGQP